MLQLNYGGASERITCPHRDADVPSADVNITILDASGTELLASTAATKGSVSTTLSAAASAGAKNITVAANTGMVVGNPIVLTDASGRSEPCEIEGINSTAIALKSRLSRAYASSDAVTDAHIYYDADISDTDDFSKTIYYQALFSSTDWDETRGIIFRVVDIKSTNPITFDDVKAWASHVDIIRDSKDESMLDKPRDNAWNLIKAKLRASGRDPDVWRDSAECANIGGLLACGLFLAEHGHYDLSERYVGNPPGMGGLFVSYWADFAKAPTWFDTDQDRNVDIDERQTPRTARLGRGL